MSSQTTAPKLNQEQSKILDDLWFEEKHSAKGRRYYEKKLDDNTDNAKDIFHNLGSESVVNYAGIWRYTLGSDRIFKNAVRSGSGSSRDPGRGTMSLQRGEGGTGYSEGAKKGHEENVQMHEEDKVMHKEKMDAYNEWRDGLYPEWKQITQNLILALKETTEALRAKANTD